VKKILILSGCVVIISLMLAGCAIQNGQTSSPNGALSLLFELEEGVPHYSLKRNEQLIIAPSAMGFSFKNMPDMKSDFQITEIKKTAHSEVWEQPLGQFRYIEDNHNELLVKLAEKSGLQRELHIIFRVFNDGLGFRYFFPEQAGIDSLVISEEHTQFSFPQEHHVWWIPVNSETVLYESLYQYSRISETDTINTPATFETADGLYLSINEANLTDYAGLHLLKESETQYRSELAAWSDGVKVYAKAPFETPWRTIIVAENPGELVTSTLMLNLNDPPVLEDWSWIEPSKYVGIWWGMHIEKYSWAQGPKHGATTQNAKKYIDFAAKHELDGVLIEGWNYGWDSDWHIDGNAFNFTTPYPDFDLEEITLYAATHNVRIIGHHETGGAVSNYTSQMEEAFNLYQKNGVNTVKAGYVNDFLDGKERHDSQFGVRHYRHAIETAAKHKIMLNIHEPVKGSGLHRTFPNYVTAEGARGQEYNAWSNDGGNPPNHTTILPFTRLLAGPMDFTPGIFKMTNPVNPNARVQTTMAKQLALYVIIFSPHHMAADLPEHYEGQQAFQFIKDVPTIWETTKVLDAHIGEYVTMVRKDRNSGDWYLGSITNELPRSFEISLDFLDKDQSYTAEIYADGSDAHWDQNPYSVNISREGGLSNNSILSINLAPGGGVAVRFISDNH